MAETSIVAAIPPEAIWDVLADAGSYEQWVVGAKRVKRVDGAWPEPGSQFHHTVGLGPINVNDRTSVVAADPGRSLTLRARARPAGVAKVVLTLTPEAGGTRVVLREDPVEGLAARLDNPLQQLAINRRNAVSLRRLVRLASSRQAGVQ